MELGEGLRRRMAELSAIQAQLPGRIQAIARGATLRAVEEATEHTPPNGDGKERGALMISGELAQHWATDSQTEPAASGEEYRTLLANNVQYASCVNDGHRMDKHFVPGLVIDPETGLLERVDPTSGNLQWKKSSKGQKREKKRKKKSRKKVQHKDKGEQKKQVIGMMVGTKTKELKGLYMAEKGIDKYREVIQEENRRLIKEVFGP